MKKSMDLFGEVLSDYYRGNRTDKFYFLVNGDKSVFDVSYYFEGRDKMSGLERKMLSLIKGRVLDVGCGAGRHILEIQKKHNVLGVDISAKNIEIAKKRGVKNCISGNFFEMKSDQKFDTITFFENGLGMAEKIKRVEKLLKKAISMLNGKGQILTIGRSPLNKNKGFIASKITPFYKDKKGTPFSWIHLSPNELNKICRKFSLKFELLGKEHSKENGLYYLARISVG